MTSELERVVALEGANVVQIYGRPPFVITRGEGMTVYDSEGRAYLDFVSGIAVNALGYNDAGLNAAITKALASGVIHTSNLYHTAAHAELAELLCETSFADRVHYCNSGAEAVEGAIKFARKVSYEAGKPDKTGIVAFENAFHGRTIGALALTPREKYQKPFRPLMPDVTIATFNDLDSARAAINADTAAVFVEPVQGEGGIIVATPEFLQGLRALCDEQDALAGLRRDSVRHGAHRRLVGLRGERHHAGHHDSGQTIGRRPAHRRHPGYGSRSQRRKTRRSWFDLCRWPSRHGSCS